MEGRLREFPGPIRSYIVGLELTAEFAHLTSNLLSILSVEKFKNALFFIFDENLIFALLYKFQGCYESALSAEHVRFCIF